MPFAIPPWIFSLAPVQDVCSEQLFRSLRMRYRVQLPTEELGEKLMRGLVSEEVGGGRLCVSERMHLHRGT